MGKNKLPPYTYLGCAVTKDKTPWCRSVCKPRNGIGQCGRPFPGHMEGRTQRAIKKYKSKQRSEEKELQNLCPKCGNSMSVRSKLNNIIKECMSCGTIVRIELEHD